MQLALDDGWFHGLQTGDDAFAVTEWPAGACQGETGYFSDDLQQ